jgi:lipopolysaccharide assembly outer membrane protein LptD (OstA)
MRNLIFGSVVLAIVVVFGLQFGLAQTPAQTAKHFTNQISSSVLVVGSAEAVEVQGAVSVYRGNVVLTESNSGMQIVADRATYDATTRKYTLSGIVLLQAK